MDARLVGKAVAMGILTADLLHAADSSNSDGYYKSIAPPMDSYADAYDISTPQRIAHFLAQIGHESRFLIGEENGSYSGIRMRQIFGCRGGAGNYDSNSDDCTKGRLRDKLWVDEDKYAHNSINLLGYVYALRLGNGDEASGEGYKYRGRGMIQLTGKDNYAKFTAAHNKNNPDDARDFVVNPDLVKTDLRYGIESAYFFWDTKQLNEIADTDDVEAVTLAVNGGTIGLADRTARLNRVKAVLGI